MTQVAFRGERFFLSNYYPCRVVVDGIEYSSSEHAFAAAKCLVPADVMLIRLAATPAEAKRIGRAIQQVRPDWDMARLEVMRTIVLAKFSDPALRALLLATGDEELVEHNYWNDRFWGVCAGNGENHLGKILMEVRMHYRELQSRHEAALPWIE